jgi:hypothetical protein
VSKGGGITVTNGQPLPGVGEAGRLSKGGVFKVGSTVGSFAMAQRWAAGRGDVVARGEATTLD